MVAFSKDENHHLKHYLTHRLDKMCVHATTRSHCYRTEADPDALADYIITLLEHDKSSADLKVGCKEQLNDFLGPRKHTLLL